MAVRPLLIALCIPFLSEPPAVSKGSSPYRDAPWDPHHIDNLPADARQYIRGICKGPPQAQHDFATYNPQEKRWRIKLEYLRCEGLGNDFRRGNQCLDVDFVAMDSHFRLARKHYADCGF
jgi:hypothetical protein